MVINWTMGLKGNIEIVLRTRDLEAKISMGRKPQGILNEAKFIINETWQVVHSKRKTIFCRC